MPLNSTSKLLEDGSYGRINMFVIVIIICQQPKLLRSLLCVPDLQKELKQLNFILFFKPREK